MLWMLKMSMLQRRSTTETSVYIFSAIMFASNDLACCQVLRSGSPVLVHGSTDAASLTYAHSGALTLSCVSCCKPARASRHAQWLAVYI